MPRRTDPAAHRWWTLAAVSLTQLLIILDGTIINIALPRAQAELLLSDSSRQWVVTAYALAFGALLLLGGRIADYWGLKRTYLLGLVVFGAASLWGGLTHSGAELLVARAGQGAAAALMAPAALAFVTISFPDGKERNKAFAIFGSIGGIGSAVGLLAGGVLTELLSWRWCLLINVPLVAVGVVLGLWLLTERRVEGRPTYDVAGALTATLGLGLLVYGLTLAEHSITAPATVGCVVAGILLLAAFVAIERRSRQPLLPLRIVSDRIRAGAFLVQFLIGAVGVATMVYLAFHLQLVLELQPFVAGVATLPYTASLMAMVPFAVRMIDRIGPRRQMIVGPLISAVGLLLLSFVTADGGYWLQVFPGLVLMGIGMGFTVVPLNNLALYRVADHDAGVASATVTATNQIGGSIGLAVVTAAYVVAMGASGASGPEALVQGYRVAFGIGAGIFAAAAVVGWFLIRPAAPQGVGEPRREQVVHLA
ncbi:MFS transporter [Tessaracoccus palaemonis]|uniref:MFS transporter n=1 Tax=Tessaracoccus palaemonis TaxID=2829499 RepID=A0ABX8SI84_9ACTN|nr:MFS transporter [Tessaracoccus palaemonis]QXT63097.1 MFS transporter [Tessaracoccus palaemonis]